MYTYVYIYIYIYIYTYPACHPGAQAVAGRILRLAVGLCFHHYYMYDMQS